MATSAPNKPVGDFDLNELMNKFLAEYETGNNNKNSDYDEHSQDISFEPEEQYEPEPHYYQPEPQQHQQQHFQGQRNPSNQGFIKDAPSSDQGYNRYQEQSTNVKVESQKVKKAPQKQTSEAKPSKAKENQTSAAKAAEQEEEVDPKLRDFTLIISKLLF